MLLKPVLIRRVLYPRVCSHARANMLPHAVATMIADSEWTVEMGTGSEAAVGLPEGCS